MRTLCTFSTLDEAQLARMKLEGSGIEAFIPDETMAQMNWLYTNAIGGIRLQVREDDLESARDVLELAPAEQGMVLCPQCGSRNVRFQRLSPFSAISIFLGFLLPSRSVSLQCQDCQKTFKRGRI